MSCSNGRCGYSSREQAYIDGFLHVGSYDQAVRRQRQYRFWRLFSQGNQACKTWPEFCLTMQGIYDAATRPGYGIWFHSQRDVLTREQCDQLYEVFSSIEPPSYVLRRTNAKRLEKEQQRYHQPYGRKYRQMVDTAKQWALANIPNYRRHAAITDYRTC